MNSKTKHLKTSHLKEVFFYIKPHKFQFLMVCIALITTSSCVLAMSFIIKQFIDTGISSHNVHMLNHSLVYLFAIIITLSVFTFVRFTLITYVGENIVARIRCDIFKHALSLSPEFYENNKTGQILSYITSDVTILLSILTSSLSFAARNMVTIIGGIVIMFTINIKLSSVILIMIPAIILPLVYIGRRVKNLTSKAQDKIGDLAFLMEQALGYIKTIQAYNAEAIQTGHYKEKNDAYLKFTRQRVILRGFLSSFGIFLAFSGIGFVLWLGGHMVLSGELSAGDFSAFLYISIVCAGAVGAISDFMGELQKASAAAERILEFLSVKPQIVSPAKAITKKEFKGNIKFDNVSFKYPTSIKKVLSNVDFEIKAGETVALVGKSGVGKSTVFLLLERFYDVTAGKILIDGVDVRELALETLRGQLTYIPQDAAIFAASVRENILYGKPNASFEEVRKAAELASCLGFIENLSEGFETNLGEKGMKLSGGQKQRISIARAILNDPKILLLDEATSSLDAENEYFVHKALDNLMKNRTVIIIAHSFKLIQKADKIIVLDKGKVTQSGSHTDLMNDHKGLFYKLNRLQFKDLSK